MNFTLISIKLQNDQQLFYAIGNLIKIPVSFHHLCGTVHCHCHLKKSFPFNKYLNQRSQPTKKYVLQHNRFLMFHFFTGSFLLSVLREVMTLMMISMNSTTTTTVIPVHRLSIPPSEPTNEKRENSGTSTNS